MACVKCQGLGKGGKIEKIREIEAVSMTQETLSMIAMFFYRDGATECDLEGFPLMLAQEFIFMFCQHMRCTPETIVTRIEFKYV